MRNLGMSLTSALMLAGIFLIAACGFWFNQQEIKFFTSHLFLSDAPNAQVTLNNFYDKIRNIQIYTGLASLAVAGGASFLFFTTTKRLKKLSESLRILTANKEQITHDFGFKKDNTEIGSVEKELHNFLYSIKDYSTLSNQDKAISRSQAIIEFTPDGTILTANENFCQAMGYNLSEIQGKHHSIFVDPDYVKSNDYKDFWTALQSGEFQQSEFKRFGKGGREIWIQASYNPIKNSKGQVTGVIKYATDITEQKKTNLDYSEQIQVLNNSQAVIEFNPSGIIIKANDNFCNTMGYALTEITGKHHSIFVDPDYAKSNDYKDFWETLRKGEFQQSEFKRFDKRGNEVWIQASYNPVVNDKGVVTRVIKYATNINEVIQARKHNDEVVAEAVSILKGISEGELRKRMEGNHQGQFKVIQDAVNGTATRLSDTINQIISLSSAIQGASHDIMQGSDDLSGRTEAQAASIEETVATMEEMSASVRNNANSSVQASTLATSTLTQAEEGSRVVAQAVTSMQNLESSSHRIAEIVAVIDSIASQTNLLALNAAVEAARAGDAGKGFAVVASEVRTLASRCSEAARDIRGLISSSNAQVVDSVKLVNATGTALRQIVESVNNVSQTIASISLASREQATGVEEISGAISQMDEMTQQNAALSDESAAAARSLAKEAKNLTNLISYFKTDNARTTLNNLSRDLSSTRDELSSYTPKFGKKTKDPFDDFGGSDFGKASGDDWADL